ncbi:hypothetical protein K8R47_02965 [archaeon]|nr:hypothetical protein [archaeon]
MRLKSHFNFYYLIIILIMIFGLYLLSYDIIEEKTRYTGKASSGEVGVCVATIPILNSIVHLNATSNSLYSHSITHSSSEIVTFYDNTTLFNISVNTGLIQFTPNSSDIGDHVVRISINNSICSNLEDFEEITFTILSSGPIFNPEIGDQSATEDVLFHYDANATDPEGLDFSFSSNETWFIINTSTGIIESTPNNSLVGIHNINLSVNNTDGRLNSEVITFTVVNVNDAPILDMNEDYVRDLLANQSLIEDIAFYVDVNATDIDAGETLTFGDTFSLFNINDETGEISFTPEQSQTGENIAEIFVHDCSAGESSPIQCTLDIQWLNITILEVNDPPNLIMGTALTLYVNDSFFSYDVNATDEEDGGEDTGNLTFTDDTDLFNISSTNGTWNITPSDLDVGTYNINITVNDTGGAMTSLILSLTITNENRPPTIDSYYPIDLTQEMDEGGSIYFNISKSDPDGTTPSVMWFVKGAAIYVTDDEYTFTTSTSGVYNLTAQISDGILTDSITWNITVNDVPETPISPGGGGGGGSAGCREIWVCSDWSPCERDNIQIRTCEQTTRCKTNVNKPDVVRECTFTDYPTCDDKILNQDEILIDCGGICEPCPTCNDGLLNQGEKGIDCGGPCQICPEELEVPKIEKPDINWLLFVGLLIVLLAIIILLTKQITKKRSRGSIKLALGEKQLENKLVKLVNLANNALKHNDTEKAVMLHNKIMDIYDKLSNKNKEKYHDRISDIYRKIKKPNK